MKAPIYPTRLFRIEAHWYGGGFCQTLRFESEETAREWSTKKFSAHSDAAITLTERDPKTFREINSEASQAVRESQRGQ